MHLEYAARTHVGLVRESNQDAILSLPDCGLFLVADGMGGENAGDEASDQAVSTVRGAFEGFLEHPPDTPHELERFLRVTLEEVNRDILQKAAASPEKSRMGTTASLLVLHRGVCFIGHVGDSRIYRYRDGALRQLTRDHTLVWILFEQGRISQKEMETHPDRHLLTQCLGSSRPLSFDTAESEIRSGDLYLLCSDGLTGYVSEEKVSEILGRNEPLEASANQLLEAALAAGGGDNVSVILARTDALDEADSWKPEDTEPLAHFDTSSPQLWINTEILNLPELPVAAGKKFRGPAIAGVLALTAAILLAAGFIFHYATRTAAIYFDAFSPTDRVSIFNLRDGKPVPPPVLAQDARGYHAHLARPGEYQLAFKREGYLDINRKLKIAPRTGSLRVRLEWRMRAQLILQLPEESTKVTRLDLKAEDEETSYRLQQTWSAAGLAGKRQVEVGVAPEVVHEIEAQADGCAPFALAVEVPPGLSRVVRIVFSPAKKK